MAIQFSKWWGYRSGVGSGYHTVDGAGVGSYSSGYVFGPIGISADASRFYVSNYGNVGDGNANTTAVTTSSGAVSFYSTSFTPTYAMGTWNNSIGANYMVEGTNNGSWINYKNPSTGTGGGYFAGPKSQAWGQKYIAAYGKHLLFYGTYSSNGNYVYIYQVNDSNPAGGSTYLWGEPSSTYICDGAYTSAGKLYVTKWPNLLYRFAYNGSSLTFETSIAVSGLTGIWGITIAADEAYAYVTDGNLNKVFRVRLSDGAVMDSFGTGSATSTTSGFNTPRCIARSGDYLYVADYSNNRVMILSDATATAPGTPGTPLHNGAPTTTSIPVTWSASSGTVSTYYIYRNGSYYTQTGSSANYFTDNSVSAGVGYTYYVVAYNGATPSAASGSATLYALTDATSISSVTPATTSATVYLTTVANASGYRVYNSGGTLIGSSSTTTVTINSLSPGTTYSNIYARAVNQDGWVSSASGNYSFTTKPAAVTGLYQSSATTSGGTITWNAAAGANTYIIFLGGSQYDSSATTSYTYTALTAGGTQDLQVKAYNNTSGFSEDPAPTVTVYAKCDPTPSTPSISASQTTDTVLYVFWAASAGGDSYSVYKNGVSYASGLGPYPPGGSAYPITGLAGATSYNIHVTAWNSSWESAGSPVTAMLTRPAKMSISALQPSDVTRTSAVLRWSMTNGNKPASVTAKSSDLLTTYSSTTDINAGTTTITGLDTATVYSVKLIGTNATGDSVPSDAMSVTLKCAIPAAPTVSNITASGCRISWSAVANATGYAVYKDNVFQGTTTNLYYDASGLTSGTSYNFAVEAYNWITYDGSKSDAITVLTLPSAPTGLSVTTSTNSANVTWTAISGGAPTNVVAFSDASCTALYPSQSTNMGTKTISVAGLSPNTAYTFYVKAQNATGYSTTYTSASGTTTVGAPTGLTLNSKTSTTADLSWTAPSGGATSYNVYGLPGSPINTAITSIAPTNLVPATEYTVYVKAVVGTESAASNTVVFTTDDPAPGTPTGLAYSASTASGYTLSWNITQYATSYDIYQDDVFYTSVPGTSTSITGIVQGHKHVWKVLAKNSTGSSALSAGVPAYTIPPNPTGLVKAAPSTTSSIFTSWQAVEAGQDMTFEIRYDAYAYVNVGTSTSHEFTVMASNTVYTVWLKVVNPAGESAAPSTVSIYTLPLLPEGFTATETLSTSITVGFSPPQGPAPTLGFYVSIQQADASWNPAGQKTSVQKAGSATSHTFIDLIPETNYLVSIFAYNAEGNSAESTIQCTTTDIDYIIGQVLLDRADNERVTTTFTELWGGMARAEDGPDGSRRIAINNGMCVVVRKKVEAPQFGIIAPSTGSVGTQVTITGKELGYSRITSPPLSQVFIGDTEVTNFSSWTDTSITFTVPAGATTGNVVVWTSGGKVTGTPFTVTT